MKKLKELFRNLDKGDIKKIVKTNSFIIVMLVACFPIGIILMWASPNFRRSIKIVSTIMGTLWVLLFFIYALSLSWKIGEYNKLMEDYSDLAYEKDLLLAENSRLETSKNEYIEYKEKMTPYESLSEVDAKKRQNDGKIAQKVSDEVTNLPEISSMSINDKEQFNKVKESYDKLTNEQKELVDSSLFIDYENKVKELETKEAKAKEEAEAKEEASKKKAEEEAKGYDTGISYDQLARTPDDYMGKKVKFYGKVIQVMESDTSTQIRLAVDDNHDTIIYADYNSTKVTSRVLEDDYVTISGISMGLLSYKSTMGGKITIPSVLVNKIDQ